MKYYYYYYWLRSFHCRSLLHCKGVDKNGILCNVEPMILFSKYIYECLVEISLPKDEENHNVMQSIMKSTRWKGLAYDFTISCEVCSLHWARVVNNGLNPLLREDLCPVVGDKVKSQ